jgi:DNA-binding CsgD family transcriptional regulator
VREALDAPGWEMYEPSARAILGHILIERGDHDGARTALTMADAEAWSRTVPYAMLLETRSRLHVSAGDLAAAATDLAGAGELLSSMGNCSPFCPWRSSLGVVTARQGDVAAGRALIDEELEQAFGIGTPRATGVALHARGVVGRLDGADGLGDFSEAAEVLEGCGARLEHARALSSLGAALAAAGRRRDARGPLREALALARELGAADVAGSAARNLGAAGGRPARGRLAGADTKAVPAGLTASELRIAHLVARGLTNREIAEELVVTSHTVRFHLTGIYRKLGVGAREEVGPSLRAAERPTR